MEDPMPWTNIARREHKRETDRYPSDLTDAEWLVIASLLPAAKSGGRKRTTELREVVNGILYIASSGCPWRMLPKDSPPDDNRPGILLYLAGHGIIRSDK
jgi:putative transposase